MQAYKYVKRIRVAVTRCSTLQKINICMYVYSYLVISGISKCNKVPTVTEKYIRAMVFQYQARL